MQASHLSSASWLQEGSVAVGGRVSLVGKAPFASGQVILGRTGGDAYLIAYKRAANARLKGEPLSEGELEGLIRTNEGIRFRNPFPYDNGAEVWVLRENFLRRSEALESIHPASAVLLQEEHGTALILLVESAAAYKARETWENQHFMRAFEALKARNAPAAVHEAEVAWSVDPSGSMVGAAKYCAILEAAGKQEEADNAAAFELKSRPEHSHSSFKTLREYQRRALGLPSK